jgi:hypothetical protein
VLLNFTSPSEAEAIKTLWRKGYLLADDLLAFGSLNHSFTTGFPARLTAARFAVRGRVRFKEKIVEKKQL